MGRISNWLGGGEGIIYVEISGSQTVMLRANIIISDTKLCASTVFSIPTRKENNVQRNVQCWHSQHPQKDYQQTLPLCHLSSTLVVPPLLRAKNAISHRLFSPGRLHFHSPKYQFHRTSRLPVLFLLLSPHLQSLCRYTW